MTRKVDYDKLATDNILLSLNTSMEMNGYCEHLSMDGILETTLFCIAIRLYVEEDEEIIKATLQKMVFTLCRGSKFSGDDEAAKKHILERGMYFTCLIQKIIQNSDEYDPNPLYCALYRYPLTDVRYSPIGPSDISNFRNCIKKLFIDMLADKISEK